VSPSSSAGASPVHSRRGSLTVNSGNSNSTTVGLSVPTVAVVQSPVPGPIDRNHKVEGVAPAQVKQEPKHDG
jgi:hypothetical protein